MKTVTEFSGFYLRDALRLKNELFQKKKQEALEKSKAEEEAKKAEATAAASTPAEGVTEESVSVVEETVAAETAPAEVSAELPTEAPVEEAVTQEAAAPSQEETPAPASEGEGPAPVEAATPTAPESTETPAPGAPLKVISRNGFSKKPPMPQKRGKQQGKNRPQQKPFVKVELTDDEIKAILTETLKLEGEKLEHVKNALQAVDGRRAEDLRRVVVMTFEKEEKAPSEARQMGEHYYVPEYMASLQKPKFQKRPEGKGRRGDKKGKGRGRRNERGGSGDRNDRGEKRGEGRRFDNRRQPRSPQGRGPGPQPKAAES